MMKAGWLAIFLAYLNLAELSSTGPLVPNVETASAMCNSKTGHGLVKKLKKNSRVVCSRGGSPAVTQYGASWLDKTMEPFAAAHFTDLELDFTSPPRIHQDIPDCSMDDARHDPRFSHFDRHMHCGCDTEWHGDVSINDMMFMPELSEGFSCSKEWRPSTTGYAKVYTKPVFLISRRDADHNPYFTTNIMLNAFVLAKVRGISLKDVTFLSMDDGDKCHWPINDMFATISAGRESLMTKNGQRLLLKDATFVSTEYSGLTTQNLNHKTWSCDEESSLVQEFRDYVLERHGLTDVRSPSDHIVATLVSRPSKNRDNRALFRVMDNESELVAALQKSGVTVNVHSFESGTNAEHIRAIRGSDIVIGMHGAGLAHLMWAYPGTTVIEVMPRDKQRFTYRRLSAFLGLHYSEYRAGRELSMEGKHVDTSHFQCYLEQEWDCIKERKAKIGGDMKLSGLSPKCSGGGDHSSCFTSGVGSVSTAAHHSVVNMAQLLGTAFNMELEEFAAEVSEKKPPSRDNYAYYS